ncbi:MAG TPA: hypothetical protein PKL31_10945 [Fulvivirga sp.]|nr:hypothetical protein [Fulvivirga sp.]
MRYITMLIILLFSTLTNAQDNDTTMIFSTPEKKVISVNNCTPWDHAKCIYITGKEVYEDGRNGMKTKHWWRMSYIGQACRDQHGKVFGIIFEGIFVIPHYTGVALGNGIGILVRILRGPKKDG